MVPTHVDVAIENTKEKCKIMEKKKIYTKEELLAKMPKRMNKLGEWYFSDDPNKLHVVIRDMRAVLR